MTAAPRVSIVTSVYNGGGELRPTIDSLLGQTFTDFELILVDDGSTDESGDVLQSVAKSDSRVTVLTQSNAGLTRALAEGCRIANGEFIARQDVGDRSLPRRLEMQVAFLDSHPEVVAVGAGCRRIGPKGEYLGEIVRRLDPRQVTAAFLEDGIGISHTVAMFRRDAFVKAGGYRSQFRFAQDTDLWHRMSRVGLLGEIGEVLFEWGIDVDGISSTNSDRQIRLADLARQSYDAVERGESDDEILARAEIASWEQRQVKKTARGVALASAEHFIGSQLFACGDKRCREYLISAIGHRPFWLRPWVKLALSYFRLGKSETVGPFARTSEGLTDDA